MPLDREQVLRRIVERRQAMKVKEGRKMVYLDLFTAQHILAVHDALRYPENRRKLLAMPWTRMAEVCFKTVGKAK